jgi:putative nucleotide binding protein
MVGREEHAIVLDFLPEGHPLDRRPSHRKTAVAQGIGKTRFSLLEMVPREGVYLNIGDEVYIGEGKREKIHHVEGRISLDKLTNTAQGELQHVIEQLVKSDEKRFVEFFNKAQPLSTRMHSLELLPGIGKKHMWEVLEARSDGDFSSFEDIKQRVKLLPEPQKLVIRRILEELRGDEKHRLFTE